MQSGTHSITTGQTPQEESVCASNPVVCLFRPQKRPSSFQFLIVPFSATTTSPVLKKGNISCIGEEKQNKGQAGNRPTITRRKIQVFKQYM